MLKRFLILTALILSLHYINAAADQSAILKANHTGSFSHSRSGASIEESIQATITDKSRNIQARNISSGNSTGNSTSDDSFSALAKGVWDYFMTWYHITNYLIAASCISAGGLIIGFLLIKNAKFRAGALFLAIAALVWCVPVLIAAVIIAVLALIISCCICAMANGGKGGGGSDQDNRA
ncbi:hypothetical protein FGO68_gene15280 [Halteria grandinella]|uniref:DUF4064 domain-containing protein n=1 Tax=Halteria grandinella TaxID=5974 RepID=A0A8J8NJH6_HALGN|nr:hypothetical protein FGO68_gene15280 [Halteria grandinella]